VPLVRNEDIQAHTERVEYLARTFKHPSHPDYDDYIQEAYIMVWWALQRNIYPTTEMIQWRMKNWQRYIKKLERLEAASYEESLEREWVE
jgi:hypothetical protein